jgi:hypothetical protein
MGPLFVHGEVVGIDIGSIGGDFRDNFTESLRVAIKKCFECHVRQTASRCIGNPVFVKVISNFVLFKSPHVFTHIQSKLFLDIF